MFAAGGPPFALCLSSKRKQEAAMNGTQALGKQVVRDTGWRSRSKVSPALAPVIDIADWECGSESRPTKDALDVIARSATAAFAVDANDRIIYWNAGAEKLLGHAAKDALGRYCHEVLSGNDPFGNLYCSAQCPIVALMKTGTTPEPFCMDVKRREPGRLKVRVRTVGFPTMGPDLSALVHLLDRDDDARLEKLVTELRATAQGAAAEPAPAGTPNPLTRREREIVDLLSNGFAALNIAARLNLSHATVRNHIQNILRKLEVHSQVEAIAVSFRNQWI
jgi:DNA-binding CsgD family transcriptional regulator